MSVFSDVLDTVRELAQSSPGVYSIITSGALPPDNGITLTLSSGAPRSVDLDKGMHIRLTCVVNAKHTDQRTAMDALGSIHDALTRRKAYPATDAFQITDIETVAVPHYIDREDSGQFLFGSSIRIKFYYRR